MRDLRRRHRGLLVDHLSRDGDDVVFDELGADCFDICKITSARYSKVKSWEHTLLGVDLAHVSRAQCLLAELCLFLDALLVALGKTD